MNENISDSVNDLVPYLVSTRRRFHAMPELSFQENATAAAIALELQALGLEVKTGIGKTGLTAAIEGASKGPTLMIRADIDALPIDEATGLNFASSNGAMHACGHDGHIAVALGTARVLAAMKDRLRGRVVFAFQPAEEIASGALAMLEDGLFTQFPCDSVFGMHNRPGLAAGRFAIRRGALMAGGALFDITVRGAGAHGGRPQAGIDPVIVAAHIATASQTIVSRTVDPREVAVLSFTTIASAESYNVIPQTAYLKGTARAFSSETLSLIETGLERVARGVAAALGAEVDVDFRLVFAPLINSEDEFAAACDAAAGLVGEEACDREGELISASDDFSFMMNAVPGAYILIGQGDRDTPGQDWHHPRYDFNDEILPLGASYWVRLVEAQLAPGP